VQTELLAQLIEEVSLLASDMRRKEPLTVPRPYGDRPPAQTGQGQQQAPPRMSGHRKMLAAAAKRGMVRSA
jgi:hypothetical protein